MAERPILIKNGLVLDAERAAPERLDLLVRDGRIAAIGPPGTLTADDAEVVDAHDRLVIPGLVNAHTHSHLAFAKGIQDRWNLELHLNAGPWTNVLFSHHERRLSTLLSAAEMISKGCTAAYDLHFEIPEPSSEGMLTVADAYREAGMRALIAPMLADRSIWTAIPGLLEAAGTEKPPGLATPRPPEAVVENAAQLVKSWSRPRTETGLALAPTIPHHCSDPLLLGCARLSRDEGVPLHMHLAESKLQAVAGPQVYGTSLTHHIAEAGLISERFTAAHAVWLEDDEFDLLARHGAKVAHNPGSNLRLGNGIAAVRRMLDRGITMGIGTDASSCADGLNMFEATRTAALVSHIMSGDPERWLTSREVFRMATIEGARLLGLEHDIGQIAVGYLADLVFLDLDHLNYIPLNDALQQIVFMENGAAVRRVLVGGRTVYLDGKLTKIDMGRLRRDVEAAVENVRSQVVERRRVCDALEPVLRRACLCMTSQPLKSERRFECT